MFNIVVAIYSLLMMTVVTYISTRGIKERKKKIISLALLIPVIYVLCVAIWMFIRVYRGVY